MTFWVLLGPVRQGHFNKIKEGKQQEKRIAGKAPGMCASPPHQGQIGSPHCTGSLGSWSRCFRNSALTLFLLSVFIFLYFPFSQWRDAGILEQKGKQGASFCPCLAQKMGDSMSYRLSEATADKLEMGEPRDQVDIQIGAAIPGVQVPEVSSSHTVKASVSSLKTWRICFKYQCQDFWDYIYEIFIHHEGYINYVNIFYFIWHILYIMNIH